MPSQGGQAPAEAPADQGPTARASAAARRGASTPASRRRPRNARARLPTAVDALGRPAASPGGRGPEPLRTEPGGRARHLLVAAFVLAYLAAGGVTLALGQRVAGGGWLALHLVLLGAATNAIVVWSEYFAAALLRTPPVSERAGHGQGAGPEPRDPGRARRRPQRPLGPGRGRGVPGRRGRARPRPGPGAWDRPGPAGPAARDRLVLRGRRGRAAGRHGPRAVAGRRGGRLGRRHRALRLAHVHLNVLGWVGLAVVGTQFTLWPTVLRTRMVPGLELAVRWSLPPLAVGLAVAAAGLAAQQRAGRAGRAGRLRGRAGRGPGPVRPHGPAAAAAHGGVLDARGRHGLAGGRGRGRPGRPGRQPAGGRPGRPARAAGPGGGRRVRACRP